MTFNVQLRIEFRLRMKFVTLEKQTKTKIMKWMKETSHKNFLREKVTTTTKKTYASLALNGNYSILAQRFKDSC